LKLRDKTHSSANVPILQQLVADLPLARGGFYDMRSPGFLYYILWVAQHGTRNLHMQPEGWRG
jgi:hypothetical protein